VDATPAKHEFTVEQLMPRAFEKVLNETPDDIQELSDQQLITKGNINQKDWELRTRLWFLLDISQKKALVGDTPTRLTHRGIADGICSDNYLTRMLKDPYKGAFYLRPMRDFATETEGLLSIAMTRLKEILTAPVTRRDGSLDPAASGMIVSITKMLADRKFGQAVQRRVNENKAAETPEQVAEEIEVLEAELDE
jgi:hypothetical protein